MVKAIHIPTNTHTMGYHIQTQKDLDVVESKINPLVYEGIIKYVNQSIPIFINFKGGYCPVEGVYKILN